MIETGTGSIFGAAADEVEALVNTVNCIGVMGAGVAAAFKQRFSKMFAEYARACRSGNVVIGKMHISSGELRGKNKLIFNFPTKRHWQDRSKLDWIESGLVDLVFQVERFRIGSIAIPALGCSNGGLNWLDVRPLIEYAFKPLPEVRVVLFAPLVMRPNVRY